MVHEEVHTVFFYLSDLKIIGYRKVEVIKKTTRDWMLPEESPDPEQRENST